jgi:hypothetical protein
LPKVCGKGVAVPTAMQKEPSGHEIPSIETLAVDGMKGARGA